MTAGNDRLELRFPGGVRKKKSYKKRRLAAFSFFEPMLADGDSTAQDGALDMVEGSSECLDLLLHLDRHGELPLSYLMAPEPRPSSAELVRCADFLGASQATMRYLRLGLRARRHLAGTCPDLLRSVVDAGAPLLDLITGNDSLCRVQAHGAAAIGSLLFPDMGDCGAAVGTEVLRRPDQIAARLPPCVVDCMRLGAGTVALAGGAALCCVANGFNEGDDAEEMDFDLFVYGTDAERAYETLEKIVACTSGAHGGKCFRTANTVTCVLAKKKTHVVIQVVLRLFSCLRDVLANFDLPPCRVAVHFDAGEEGALRAWAAPGWAESVSHRTVWADPMQHSDTYVRRLLKYRLKGFNILLCPPRLGEPHPGTGLSELLEAAENSKDRDGVTTPYLTCRAYINLVRMWRKRNGHHDYDNADSEKYGCYFDDYSLVGVGYCKLCQKDPLPTGRLGTGDVRARCAWVACGCGLNQTRSQEWDEWDPL